MKLERKQHWRDIFSIILYSTTGVCIQLLVHTRCRPGVLSLSTTDNSLVQGLSCAMSDVSSIPGLYPARYQQPLPNAWLWQSKVYPNVGQISPGEQNSLVVENHWSRLKLKVPQGRHCAHQKPGKTLFLDRKTCNIHHRGGVRKTYYLCPFLIPSTQYMRNNGGVGNTTVCTWRHLAQLVQLLPSTLQWQVNKSTAAAALKNWQNMLLLPVQN